MFETLFTRPAALRRHREGPLASERETYLEGLATLGIPRGTILHRASYSLCVAIELGRWPPTYCFNEDEIRELASGWATWRVEQGKATDARCPRENFCFTALEFLRFTGRLHSPPAAAPGRYTGELADFITAKKEGRWRSAATCRSATWHVTKFLSYLDHRGVALAGITAIDVDGYLEHMAHRWCRVSLSTSAKVLRAWLAHCEARGWVRRGLAVAILVPRIYQHEGLPLGPTWKEVGRLLIEACGNTSAQLRNYAILLLLTVYGLRSGEVRRLQIDDIDWCNEQIRVVRSKSGLQELLPLEPSVGNAIARYLRHGRPRSDSRVVFLTVLAPHRALSAGGLYNIVESHLSRVSSLRRGRGPHGLRHACARHLINGGQSFEEVGDHLGHRTPNATRIYAKVDLTSLRRVAFEDLGGLS